ncbi:MAG: hypothetical protein WC004_00695 [Candidatus Absconditabacterales bacterium]
MSNSINKSDANNSIEKDRETLQAELQSLQQAVQVIQNLDQMEAFGKPFITFIEHYKAFALQYSKIDVDVNIEGYQNWFLQMIGYIKEGKYDTTVERLKDRILHTDLLDFGSNIKEVGLSFNNLYERFVDGFLREALSGLPQCKN